MKDTVNTMNTTTMKRNMKMIEDKVIMCVMLAMLAFMPQSCMIRINNAGFNKGTIAGSGNLTENRVEGLGDFDKISISLPMDIEYAYGEPSVVIFCDDNVYEYIDVKCNDNVLLLAMSNEKAYLRNCKLKARISSPELDAITLSGSGSFEADGIQAAEFEVTVAGSGEVSLASLKVDSLQVTVAGSGDVDLDEAESCNMDLIVTGSGDIEVNGVKTDNLELCIAGSGDITIEGNDAGNVAGTVMGSGCISIAGKAQKASFSLAGSGTVEHNRFDCPELRISR